MLGKCGETPIVDLDLWGTKTPAFGLNGTGPDKYEEGLFKQQLLDIVTNHNASQPLFLYYATHAPHDPYQVPDSYYNRFNFIDTYLRLIYHAMVTYVDDVVGELVNTKRHVGQLTLCYQCLYALPGSPLAYPQDFLAYAYA